MKSTQAVENNKEYIEEFAATISQELAAIKPLKELDNYPNATKEEWLIAIGNAKTHFEEDYQNLKQYASKDSTQHKERLKAFGIPPSEWTEFKKLLLKEIFVDEEILALTKGFMLGPVGVYNNKSIVAFNEQQYDNIYEMRNFLMLQAKTKDIVIYYTAKEGDKYIFRGAFIDKNNES